MLASALITTRDGIAGTWSKPEAMPVHLPFDEAANLERWAPDVRAAILDAELLSRLAFTTETAHGDVGGISIWHGEFDTGARPAMAFTPLIRMNRPAEQAFHDQLDLVHGYAELRTDRAAEILAQLGMPTGFLAAVAFLRPDRSRHTLELLALAFRLARFVHMRAKHALACRRPIEYSPQVQPMIETPGHGALPSGHATEAFMLAAVLWAVMRAGGNPTYRDRLQGIQLMRLASRIAINRQVAGVHFPVDSAAGAVLGLTLATYLGARSDGCATSYPGSLFQGDAFPGDEDLRWYDLLDVDAPATGLKPGNPYLSSLGDQPVAPASEASPLHWLWSRAVAEWS